MPNQFTNLVTHVYARSVPAPKKTKPTDDFKTLVALRAEHGHQLYKYMAKSGQVFEGFLVRGIGYNCNVRNHRFERWRQRPENSKHFLSTSQGAFIKRELFEEFLTLEPTIRLLI